MILVIVKFGMILMRRIGIITKEHNNYNVFKYFLKFVKYSDDFIILCDGVWRSWWLGVSYNFGNVIWADPIRRVPIQLGVMSLCKRPRGSRDRRYTWLLRIEDLIHARKAMSDEYRKLVTAHPPPAKNLDLPVELRLITRLVNNYLPRHQDEVIRFSFFSGIFRRRLFLYMLIV